MKVLHLRGPIPLFTNTFILLDERGSAAVIDPAAKAGQYLDILEKEGAKLTHILLTHGHFDHVGAVQELKQATGAKVFAGEGEARGTQLHPLTPEQVDEFYRDEQTIPVGQAEVKVFYTPGHSQGCVCLLCGDVMFTGDTLFAGDIGRTDLETSNPDSMRKSLARLCRTIEDDVQVLPGHNDFSTMGRERAQNPYLQEFVNA